MLKAIHAQESREARARKAEEVVEKLESMRLRATARTERDGFAETLAYTEFPPEHWRRIRTNNGIERINREIKRRKRAVETFPDGASTEITVCPFTACIRSARTTPSTTASISQCA
jgi:putative transposase